MADESKTDPNWTRNRNGSFHRLVYLDPEKEGLSGVSGVFVVWHGGLKPEWITVGKSANLGQDLDLLLDNEDIEYYENRGGIFVTWSLIRKEFQDGVLRYLIDNFDLLVPPSQTPAKKTEAIPVFAPGMEPQAEAMADSLRPSGR